MHLYLTSNDPWNSSYCTEHGHVLFKVICPAKLGGARTATVWQILDPKPTSEGLLWAERHFPLIEEPHSPCHMLDNDFEILEESRVKSIELHDHEFHWGGLIPSRQELEELSNVEVDNQSTKLAEIEFHNVTSTRIRYMGEEWKTSSFFRSGGRGSYGRDYIFSGPDGREYNWKMSSKASELFLVGPTGTHSTHPPLLIARLHNPYLKSLPKNRPASLKIFPDGEHMIDIILITSIYMEKVRHNSQWSAPHSSANSGVAMAALMMK